MGHTGTSDGLHQGLLDDAVLDVQRQLARALLRRALVHTVGIAADVLDLIRLYPLALFGNGRRSVVRTLLYNTHVFYFV